MQTMVYKYHCKAPDPQSRAILDEQISLAHAYHKRLVELERRRRERIEEELCAHHPRIVALTEQAAELQAEREKLTAEIKRQHVEAKSRKVAAPEKAALRDVKQRLRVVWSALKEAREAAWKISESLRALREQLRAAYKHSPAGSRTKHKPAELLALEERVAEEERALHRSQPFHAAVQRIETEHSAAVKQARSECGVCWGTYIEVERRVKRSGPPPRFPGWTGEGVVSVQIQGGMSFADALAGEDGRLAIDPLPADAWDTRPRRRKRTRVHLRLMVSAGEPVIVHLRTTLDRPLPEEAQIKWVTVVRRKVGPRYVWSLDFTLATRAVSPAHARRGRVGVDVGWRLTDEGLRVAYWVGDDGAEGQLVIPHDVLHRARLPSEFRSAKDERFNRIVAHAADQLAGLSLPDDLAGEVRYMRQWRSPGRLVVLRKRLLASGVISDGDELAEVLRRWEWEDAHLWRLQATTAKRFARWRKDAYRKFAAELSRRYRTIAIEDVAWKKLSRRADADEQSADGALTEYIREASPFLLQQILSEAAAEVDKLSAVDTTRRCAVCGEYTGESDPAALSHTCVHCGATQDQDRIAALNLLWPASGSAAPKSTGALA